MLREKRIWITMIMRSTKEKQKLLTTNLMMSKD
jgi:hypothetical protein